MEGSSILLSVNFVGDIMLARLIDQFLPFHVSDDVAAPDHEIVQRMLAARPHLRDIGHEYVWGNLLDVLNEANMTIGNLETAVTTCKEKWPNKNFNYRMHPSNLKCLQLAKVRHVSLANNHRLDFGIEGLKETMETLKEHKVSFAGVGDSHDEALAPKYIDIHGTRFAFFSASDHPEEWKTIPGFNFIDLNNVNWKQLQDNIEKARKCPSEVIVYSIHWGPNYRWKPDAAMTSFAHGLIDMGVDIVHGHSSHHVQGIEFYRGKPIIYGCGDFIDDYAVDAEYRNDLGFIYTVRINVSTEKRYSSIDIESIRLTPTRIANFQVRRAEGEDEAWLEKTMTSLCADFGTRVERMKDGSLRVAGEQTRGSK